MAIAGIDAPLPAPALRALEALGVRTIRDLSRITRTGLEEAPGVGKNALKAIEAAMRAAKVAFGDEAESEEVSAYIAGFEGAARERLMELRAICRKVLPEAREKLAYGMPTYFYGGNVIHFAGFKAHVSIFPMPDVIVRFKARLEGYATSKGGIQFPLDRPLPKRLIREIAEFRLARVLAKIEEG
jgi:uncharacterized protein YdhG (YjbR/CyaY superfamily)